MTDRADDNEESDSPGTGGADEQTDDADAEEEDLELSVPSPDLPSPDLTSSSEDSRPARIGSPDDGDSPPPVPPPPPDEVASGSEKLESGLREAPDTGEVDPLSEGEIPGENEVRAEADESTEDEVAGEGDGEDELTVPAPSVAEPEETEVAPSADGSPETDEPPPSASTLLDQDQEFDADAPKDTEVATEPESATDSPPSGAEDSEPVVTKPPSEESGEEGAKTEPEPAGEPTDVLQKSELREALDSYDDGPRAADAEESLEDRPAPTPANPNPKVDPDAVQGGVEVSPAASDSSRDSSGLSGESTAPVQGGDFDEEAGSPDDAAGASSPDAVESASPEDARPDTSDDEAAPAEQPLESGGPVAESDPEMELDSEREPAPRAETSAESADRSPKASETSETPHDPGGERRSRVDASDTLPGADDESIDFDSLEDEAGLGSWGGWRPSRTAVAISGLIGIVLAAIASAAAVVTYLDRQQIQRKAQRTEQLRQPDTYAAWREAYDAAATASDAFSDPAPLRSNLYWIGDLIGMQSPIDLHRRIRGRRAFYAAVVEYRFERAGSRNAAALAEEAFSDGKSFPVLRRAAEVYRFLAQHRPREALGVLEDVEISNNGELLIDAELAAALESGDGVAIRRVANRAVGSNGSSQRKYLLARAARYRDDASATDRLRKFLADAPSEHFDAHVALVRAMFDEGQLENALQYASKVESERLAGASNYQRAKLSIAVGEIHRARGDLDQAQSSFRAAVQAEPKRTSVHLPLIDLLLDRANLEEARAQISRARSLGRDIPALAVDEARLAFLHGDFTRTLELLEDSTASPNEVRLLKGRALLHLERTKRAAELLEGAGGSIKGPASALRTLAQVQLEQIEMGKAEKRVDELASQHPENPLVQRAAARVHLYGARHREGEEQKDLQQQHLERAIELLASGTPLPADRALDQYLLCECHLFAKNAREARESCGTGRRINPRFLPGMYTVARMHLVRGETDKVRLLLDGLDRNDEPRWRMTELRVRAVLRDRRPNRAWSHLEKWKGTAPARRGELAFFRGLAHFEEGAYEEAIRNLEKAAKKGHDPPERRLYLAHALIREDRDTERAAEWLLKLNDHSWWEATAWLVFGELRRRQGRTRDALANLQNAETSYNEEFAASAELQHLYAEFARTWARMYDWNNRKVREYLDEARSVTEGSTAPELHLALAERALSGREPDVGAAIEHLTSLLERQPHRCEAARALARAFRERYDEEKAREKVDGIEVLSSGRCTE